MSRNGISAKVRRMTPTRYTTAEAAPLVGRSADTLVRWRKRGMYQPSDEIRVGSLTVFLYTDEDIENMSELARATKTGRPVKKKEEPSPEPEPAPQKIVVKKGRKKQWQAS